ncbi:hypothetical protein C8R47DRAFT_1329332 [Mycena vitilis]|nr:hypothetical protein C8R47DRAFT_1329332 [Mycena vitilis]
MQVAAQRVQAVFGKYAQPTPHPAILLVHNVETALTVLSNIGVDLSHWDLQLRNLLRSPDSADPASSRGLQHPVNARARRYAPIYVVDVKALFTALLGIQPAGESVPEICKRLELYKPTGWCAGNECWMLVDVFRRIAAGGNIDEQGLDWPQPVRTPPVVKEGVESESEYGDSDDE